MNNLFVKFIGITLAILFFTILTAPQSFAIIKLPLLFIVIAGILIAGLANKFKIDFATLAYYLSFSIIVIIWLLIGVIKGAPMAAIIDYFRLYIVFMWIYALIVFFVSNMDYEKYFPILVGSAAISIALINFLVTGDAFLGLESIPIYLKTEMLLEVGIHKGYVQLNSLNIGMLSFITPFLISIWLSKSVRNRPIILIAIVLSFLAILLSSRRAILFIVFLAPFLTYIVCKLTQGVCVLKPVLNLYLIVITLAVIFLVLINFYNSLIYEGFIERVLEVFTYKGYEVRSTQGDSLLTGFFYNIFLGSGFGGQVDIVRNLERPWIFELTYSQMLFNFGLIGMTFWIALFPTFVFIVITRLRVFSGDKRIYNAMLVGFVSVILVSWTNPYLGSFDYLFILSIIPFIMSSVNIKKSLFPLGVK